ncbi:MAG TPA: hypothetical protein VNI84_18380 [Pyrinomonadaceae bacterium]|nr:hypothetical protein [Pyrinomonadaceae bacterium]
MNEAKDFRKGQNSKTETGTDSKNTKTLKRIGIVAAIAFAAFLLGFVPMWLAARGNAAECEAARDSLRLSVLQNNLATAAISAQNGEFEQARQQTSDFYTALRAEVDRENSAVSEQQREAVRPILAQRDETITLLARNDAAAADRLSDLYFAFMQAKNTTVSKNSAAPRQ